MKAPSFAIAVTALAFVAAAPASAPFAFVPAHTGESQAYRYEVDETGGPRGAVKVRQSITLAREANDRLKITVAPDDGTPTTMYAIIAADGSLSPAPVPLATRAPYATRVNAPAPAPGASAVPTVDPSLPMDRPILALPGGGQTTRTRGGAQGSGYPGGSTPGGGQQGGTYPGGGQAGGTYPGGGQAGGQSFPRVTQPSLPRNVQIVGSLIAAARGAQAPTTNGFAFSAVVGEAPRSFSAYNPSQTVAPSPAPAPAVPMTAKLTALKAGDTQIVADGNGSVVLGLGALGDGASTGGQQRRGGGGRGGQGGGIGGILIPGGGAGGSGRGQGGAGRRPQAGGATSTPATMNLHVESTFHNGVLQVARGKTTTTYTQNGANVTTTSTWLLSAY
jgi:hypothetical protein